MTGQPDRVAADIAAIRETLAGIGIDDQSQGAAADAMRAALAQRGVYLDSIADAARAVARAAAQRQALVAERDAATPSDAEIRAAQEAVIEAASQAAAAAGTPEQAQRSQDEQNAIDRLADLLNQKREAQKKFESGEKASAQSLDDATKDLPSAPGSAGAFPGASAWGPLMSVLSSLGHAGAPRVAMPAGAGVPEGGGGDPVAFSPESEDPVAALLDSLGDDDSREIPKSGPQLDAGAGQTHTSAAEGGGQQMPTLSGVTTAADVSGKGSPAFTVDPSPGGAAGSAGAPGAGGVPMSPMMGPMSGGAGGVAQGKRRDKTSIINRDPDLTGADIASEIATSGVIGRGESRRR
ncbi:MULTISPECIES: hypothetical protein [Mycobacterium avium complex (MAC)]|uniref:Uncharacterized protein n=3 Tax=Mycobacterium TaxID=1763 RepID=A0AAW5SCS1_MYCBC|nr:MULTISPECIES: hypothetical protein [Mycobacterium avium complex (MAC)]ORW00146.1 hypothetical protein AWC14_00565 [Mycobacterium kyorinense]MBZ4632027.1 hypothetical protein [Mycobacterium avium subsp. hominissuis]MCV6992835.1 hypothetical protein [Mycobacterium bouchedurhonense]MCV6993318.1 hypothetical protein [Mycobacterium timonense]MDV3305604.1 hypothetical protein [Mycobacterium avium subsp. hominissuis]